METAQNFHTGAPTEEAGARMAAKGARAVRGNVYDLIQQSMTTALVGLTDEEGVLAYEAEYGKQKTMFAGNSYCRRRRELVTGGWIVNSGMTRVSSSNVPQIVWVVTNVPYNE